MQRLPLIGGSYLAKSLLANAQRCINLFPEVNPKDSPVPVTHYQRPGLVPLGAPPVAGPGRGLYAASTGLTSNNYAIVGPNVYSVSPDWQFTLLGVIAPGNTPVSLTDNGVTAMLVDGSVNGYTIDLGSNAFAQINDPTSVFSGATKVDNIDTFIIFNFPETNVFGSTHSAGIVFDPLYLGAKSDYPDPISTLYVAKHEILLFGLKKSEIWFDAGNPQLPFAELPGSFIEHGCVAPYSVAGADINVYWLSNDLQGQGVVLRQRAYQTERISNHALEYAIRQMSKQGTITDALGYTYQQDGHVFYVLTFPTGNQTWVWDESVGDKQHGWHQRAFLDANGNLQRDRTCSAAFMNSLNVVQDWQTGELYALDPETYTDAGQPILYLRTFPHALVGVSPNGQPINSNGKRMKHKLFMADIECGNMPLDPSGAPASMTLRFSDDRGRSWQDGIFQSFGAPGEYNTWPVWRAQGIARDRVYELSYSGAGQAALNGAWIDAEVLES